MKTSSQSQRIFAGQLVYPIGFGAMPLGIAGRPSSEEAKSVWRALEASPIQFIDTALAYCLKEDEIGYNERQVGAFLKSSARRDWIVGSKAGTWRQAEKWIVNGDPNFIRQSCERSLRNLGVECIDLYQLHAVDPKVPLTETIGAFQRLREEGKIREIGLSNVTLEQLREALAVTKIASVQNELNIANQTDLLSGLIKECTHRSICYFAYSPVGGYLDYRRLNGNPELKALATKTGCSTFEILLGWLIQIPFNIVPIPGARRETSLLSSAKSPQIRIPPEVYEQLESLFSSNRAEST